MIVTLIESKYEEHAMHHTSGNPYSVAEVCGIKC